MMTFGIGERLRSAREARGLSLDEIEATTRIRRRYLEALEDEAFGLLPGSAYAKGFLRTYASYLGLPAEDLIGMYPDFRAGPIVAHGSPVDVRITPGNPQSRARRIITGIAALVVIGMVFLAVMLYGQLREFALTPPPGPVSPTALPAAPSAPSGGAPPQGSAPGTQPSGPPPAASPATPPTAAPGGPAPAPPVPPSKPGSPTPAAPPGTTPAPPEGSPAALPAASGAAGQQGPLSGPLQLVVAATDRSWVRTVADGVTVFEGFLNAGDRQVWAARREVTVRIGNASALDISVNGRPLGRLGNPGDVVDKTFTVGAPVP